MLDAGIAPATGYKSKAKQEYRDQVWRDLSRRHIRGTWAVIMPARGCEEILTAIRAGIRQEDIFCFDASAAVIATSKWRKRFPKIRFAAATLADLPKKIASTGRRVSVINMDLCGNVSGDAVDQVDDFLSSGVMTSSSAFSVNLAKGREGRTLLRVLSMLNGPEDVVCDRMRAFCALSDAMKDDGRIFTVLAQGSYRENKTPMTWATFGQSTYQPIGSRAGLMRRLCALRDSGDAEGFSNLIFGSMAERRGLMSRAIGRHPEDQQDREAFAIERNVPITIEFARQMRGCK